MQLLSNKITAASMTRHCDIKLTYLGGGGLLVSWFMRACHPMRRYNMLDHIPSDDRPAVVTAMGEVLASWIAYRDDVAEACGVKRPT